MNSNKLEYISLLYILLFVLACKENTTISPSIEFKSFPEKDIQFDSKGDIISSDIDLSDFHSSDNCVECHSEHVAEWKRSMHAY